MEAYDQEVKKKKYRRIFAMQFEDFANDTTLHGVRKVFVNTNSTARRIVWGASLILMTMFVFFELGLTVSSYLE